MAGLIMYFDRRDRWQAYGPLATEERVRKAFIASGVSLVGIDIVQMPAATYGLCTNDGMVGSIPQYGRGKSSREPEFTQGPVSVESNRQTLLLFMKGTEATASIITKLRQSGFHVAWIPHFHEPIEVGVRESAA